MKLAILRESNFIAVLYKMICRKCKILIYETCQKSDWFTGFRMMHLVRVLTAEWNGAPTFSVHRPENSHLIDQTEIPDTRQWSCFTPYCYWLWKCYRLKLQRHSFFSLSFAWERRDSFFWTYTCFELCVAMLQVPVLDTLFQKFEKKTKLKPICLSAVINSAHL